MGSVPPSPLPRMSIRRLLFRDRYEVRCATCGPVTTIPRPYRQAVVVYYQHGLDHLKRGR